MPAFQFESNLSIILLIIVIVLICLYFYLDMKKVKLVNEELEKKNEMVIKEIDNIHLQMHKFFSRMPQTIVPQKGDHKINENNQNQYNTNELEQSNIKENEDEETKLEQIKEKQLEDNDHLSGILENDLNQTKLQQSSNNIFGEIDEIVSNNIFQENKVLDPNPPLIPVKYDSNIDNELEPDSYEEDDEAHDITDNSDNSDDENISEDLDEELLDKYIKMSAKDLKEKCVEMNLKHTGNKSTLARRIVENLE
jgi:hypothetical protein